MPPTRRVRHVHAWAGFALDRIFPPVCALCGAAGATLCAACRADAVARALAACPGCAAPLPASADARRCGRCLRRPPAYDATLAAALYEAPFDQLVRGLKYGATLAYAPLFAELLDARIEVARARLPDRLIPVPLARERMAERGFNQSIEIGRFLAQRIGVPLDAASMLRIHDTRPQASLPLDARRRNIRGAFCVVDARAPSLRGLRIGVVDDVMTTGATLDELARILKRAGALVVTNLVVARTPAHIR